MADRVLLRLALTVAVTGVLAGACTGDATIETGQPSEGSLQSEPPPSTESDLLSASSSLADLEALLSPCPPDLLGENVDVNPPSAVLSGTTAWWRIEGLVGDPSIERTAAVEVLATRLPGGTAAENVSLRVHPSFLDALKWAFSTSEGPDAVFAPVRDDFVLTVMMSLSPGRTLFAGQCQQEHFYRALQATHGTETETLLARLPGMTGPELSTALDPNISSSAEPGVVLLNPSDVSADILERLSTVVLVVTFDKSLENSAVCPKSTSGWNDCLLAGYEQGQHAIAYVDADGLVEFWLMDDEINLERPVKSLGIVEIPAELLTDDTIVRVHLTSIEGGIDLRAIEFVADIDLNDPIWEPLDAAG